MYLINCFFYLIILSEQEINKYPEIIKSNAEYVDMKIENNNYKKN